MKFYFEIFYRVIFYLSEYHISVIHRFLRSGFANIVLLENQFII